MQHFIKGNLFDKIHNVDAIVNTVNCVGVMGKGIAKLFKEKYPDNYTIYKEACLNKSLHTGKMLIYRNEQNSHPKYIINFPTKNHWRGSSKLEYITIGLEDFVSIIKEHNIKSVAMPALGCGNGGLDWKIVKPIIQQRLSELEDVTFYIYEPYIEQKPKTLRVTRQRKILLQLIEQYNKQNDLPATYQQVQQLAYIAQTFGVSFNVTFNLKAYGPSDDNINSLLRLFVNNQYLILEKTTSTDNHLILNTKKIKFKKEDRQLPELDIINTYLKKYLSKELLQCFSLVLWFYNQGEINFTMLCKKVETFIVENSINSITPSMITEVARHFITIINQANSDNNQLKLL